MKKIILLTGKIVLEIRQFHYLLFLFLFSIGIQSQESEIPGKVRIKLTEEMATTFESASLQRSSLGFITNGNASLNETHEHFKATNCKRVFPDGGKFEQKHRKHGLHLWYEIDIDKSQNLKEVCAAYESDSSVLIAEPIAINRKIEPVETDQSFTRQDALIEGTNDPFFSNQWHFNNIGQFGESGIDSDISLLEAWEIETGNPDVIVSIHDGGINTTHEDLVNNLWINEREIPGNGIDDDNNGYIDDIHGYNFVDDIGDILPDSHGTHVSGTVGATTNNNVGVAGIAGGNGSGNGARLMSCAVFTGTGAGGFAQSYIYAADNGAVVSQNSWGATIPDLYNQSELDAMRYFIAEAGYDELGNPSGPMQGGIVIFAAGNAGSRMKYYPGAYEEVIAVGSTDFDDVVSSFSNWGDWVDIGAPGNGVYSTSYSSRDEDVKYGFNSGTSMSCPHVSGVAALIVSKFAGNITPQEVRNRLLGSADKMPYDILGSGRLNAFAALENNDSIAPEAITDLTVVSNEQNSISYSWTTPNTQGNSAVYNYEIRYSAQPITDSNYEDAIVIPQDILASQAGSLETNLSAFDVSSTYYIAIKAMDYFGNISNISNVISVTTATAPLIELIYDVLDFNIDISKGEPSQTKLITANNIGNEVLDYKTSVYAGYVNQLYPGNGPNVLGITENNTNSTLSASTSSDNYELQTIKKEVKQLFKSSSTVALRNSVISQDSIYHDNGDEERAFFVGNPFTASAFAVRFEVEKPSFNLTHVRNYMDIESIIAESLPITIEIRKGPSIGNSELVHAQEIMPDPSDRKGFLTVPLTKSQMFTQGDVFWIIHKFSIEYSFPQGVEDPEIVTPKPNTFYRSFTEGASYNLDLNNTYVTRAISGINEDSMLVLSPAEGSVDANGSTEVSLIANATSVPNGEYTFSIIVDSNDPQQIVKRVPANVVVSGQAPEVSVSTQLLEYDITILETEQEKEFVISNTGFSDLEIDFTSNNPYFEVMDAITIPAGEEVTVPVKFSPLESGFISSFITLTTNDPINPELNVQVVGIAADPPVIEITTPFIENTLNVDQTTTETITINNTGNYPLQYSLPKFAVTDRDNSDELSSRSGTDIDFGYSWIDSSQPEGPVYVWNDIKKSGIEINIGEINDTKIELPFVFNFYGQEKTEVHVHSDGMLYFENRDEEVPRGSIREILSGSNSISDFISVFFGDEDENMRGNIYYKVTNNALIVQFDQVGKTFFNTFGLGSFQVVLLKNGNILLYYKDMTTLSIANDGFLNIIGIENSTGTDGISIYPEFTDYVPNEWAVMLTPKKANFITEVTQTTGVLSPGSSVDIDITIDASNLLDGTFENEILIFSNDPSNSSVWIPATLHVMGEQEQLVISDNTIVINDTFLGTEKTKTFSLQNSGSANVILENLISNNDQFSLDIETPYELSPNEVLEIPIIFTPSVVGSLETMITITTNVPNSESLQLGVSATSINPPVTNIDTSTAINVEAYSGDLVSDSVVIKNDGGSNLQYKVNTPEWLYVDNEDSMYSNGTDINYGYRWKDNKSETSNVTYDFVDISETGIDVSNDVTLIFPGTGSAKFDIGFDFNFYGNVYSEVWIASRGFLYFGEDQINRDFTESNRPFPLDDNINNAIAGAWDNIDMGTGVYYQLFDDHFVVQYTASTFKDDFDGVGGKFTMQIILYTNGDIKYQYKDIDEEVNSQSSYTIGIENDLADDGILIVFRDSYIENELAVLIEAPEERSITPGESVTLPLVYDASKLNKGEYTGTINVISNDPQNSSVSIPTNFTVLGDPVMETNTEEVDFGEIILIPDNLETTTKSININNNGTANLVIETITTDTDQFSVSLEEPLSIEPSDSETIDITFLADSLGEYTGNLLINSNDNINPELAIPLLSKVVDSPILLTTTKNDTIHARVKFNGSENESIIISNNANTGTLDYATTLEYLQIDETFLNIQEAKSNVLSNKLINREAQNAIADSLYYAPSNDISYNLGFDNESLSAASKFIANDDENFELSHIRAYYNPGTSQDPITIKVYKGGETPSEGQLLLTQQHSPQSSAGFDLIALDNIQSIKSQETFWVILEYPISMQRPQGVITDFVNYYYQTFFYSLDKGSTWIPTDFYFSSDQFQIRALGSKDIDWLELTPNLGEIAAGAKTEVNVEFNARGLDAGTYYANINFTSNDINNSLSTIPVRMTVNDVPEFYNTPTDTLQVMENETIEVVLQARDSDGSITSYTLNENYDNVSFESSSEMATLTFSPDLTQSGFYTFTVDAHDDFDDIGSTSFVVEVIDVNRAPFIVQEIPKQEFSNRGGRVKSIDLSRYVQDLDMDELSYTIVVTDPSLIDFTVEDNILTGEPLGRGRTFVSIIASDGKGGQVGTSFNVLSTSTTTVANKSLTDAFSAENTGFFGINNHPNPFQDETNINYQIDIAGHVNVSVFTVNGKFIKTLVDQHKEVGNYDIVFKRNSMSFGHYLYVLTINGQPVPAKIMIIE